LQSAGFQTTSGKI